MLCLIQDAQTVTRYIQLAPQQLYLYAGSIVYMKPPKMASLNPTTVGFKRATTIFRLVSIYIIKNI